jgi:hypothetical protein
MDQQLVIKLTSGDGNGVPVGLVEYPPMLYTNLKALHPGVTFSEKATASEVEPLSYGVYEWVDRPGERPYDKTSYLIAYDEAGLTKHDDGVWRLTYIQRNATQEEIAFRTENEATYLKRQRNKLLVGSDFSQLPDAPLWVKNNISAWNDYRQALRDLPQQEGFPWNITFPEAPTI